MTEELSQMREIIHSLIEQKGDKIPSDAKNLIEETLLKMQRENLPPKEALGFSPELIEAIYQHGYQLFQSGKYSEAKEVFTVLRYLDGQNPRYTFAIGACLHYSHEYLEAAGYYMLNAATDLENPLPYFHIYDCLMKAGHPLAASNALREAHRLAEKSASHLNLKNKIELELARIGSSEKEQS